ncbi:MAG TPA: carbamate kinase [Gaiellales bacterium]
MTGPAGQPIVVALGGNALLKRGEPPDIARQRMNLEVAADALAAIARDHRLVITHGNGPQVGVLALQSEASATPSPLDVLGAETEGMIGYLIEQALGNRLGGSSVATLLTQVVVDAADPAFGAPSKPIGPIYSEADARRLAAERGWTVAPDGTSFRRVVASPQPLDIVELRTIRLLLDAGVTVVCAGGGGVPVVADAAGRLHGIEAVIDKDLSAALLAERLGASQLVMLTDVEAVANDWGTPAAAPIGTIDPAALRSMRFAAGSMGPKVEAACRFVEATGGTAAIGSLADAARVVAGAAGTVVVPAVGGPATAVAV